MSDGCRTDKGDGGAVFLFFSAGFGGLTEEKMCAYGGQMFRIFFKRRGVVPNFCKKFGQFLLGTGEDEGGSEGKKGQI